MRVTTPLLRACAALFAAPSPLFAAIVDDFSVGQFELHAVPYATQSINQKGLNPNRVVGGRRSVTYNAVYGGTNVPGGVRIGVDTLSSSFKYEADPGLSAANLRVSYGDVANSMHANLAGAGENSLVFDFAFADFVSGVGHFDITVVTGNGGRYLYVPVKNSSAAFSFVLPFIAFDDDFNDTIANFSDVSYIEFGTGNGNLRGHFTLTGIRTAFFHQGDFNFDGSVDQLDYAMWQSEFGKSEVYLYYPVQAADGNRDGKVDAADYTIWRNNRTVPGIPAAANSLIPEPTGCLLFACCLFTSVAIYRPRRS